ncbi:hypothetical protein AB6A23_00445 [Paenibacillus tarimensis]
MGKNIEIFTDSSLYGDDIVELVKKYACPRCSILVHDAKITGTSTDMHSKISEYGITSMPAVIIDGKLIPSEKLVKGKLMSLFSHIFKK